LSSDHARYPGVEKRGDSDKLYRLGGENKARRTGTTTVQSAGETIKRLRRQPVPPKRPDRRRNS